MVRGSLALLSGGVAMTAAQAEIASTPPMGWRSWNSFLLEVDEAKMLAQAQALAQKTPTTSPSSMTLLALGFDEIGIDDGWQSCGAGLNGTFHSVSGETLVNRDRFPDLQRMTARASELGVKMGWYHNNCWCSELGKSAYGNPEADVRQILDAGFAGLKIDGCGPAHGIELWTAALAAAGAQDQVVVENCANNGKLEDVWSPDQGLPSSDNPLPVWQSAKPDDVRGSKCDGFHMYRISRDISPQFYSTMWNLQQMLPFLGEEPLSRPGCWAYPDMLQLANALSFHESRSHFGAWCVTSSPLVLGFNLTDTAAFEEVYPIISNKLAIEVNQAWAGHPGRLVKQSSDSLTVNVAHTADAAMPDQSCRFEVGVVDLFATPLCEIYTFPEWQVWSKPMSVGRAAVFVVNIGDALSSPIEITLEEIGITSGSPVRITDIWTGSIAPHSGGPIVVPGIPSHDSAFFFVESVAVAV